MSLWVGACQRKPSALVVFSVWPKRALGRVLGGAVLAFTGNTVFIAIGAKELTVLFIYNDRIECEPGVSALGRWLNSALRSRFLSQAPGISAGYVDLHLLHLRTGWVSAAEGGLGLCSTPEAAEFPWKEKLILFYTEGVKDPIALYNLYALSNAL